jgi:hypothetical protein
MLFGLFNLVIAIALFIVIDRARKDKQLKITLISGLVTKVEKIVLTGRGLTVAVIGFGMSATLFTFSGLSTLLAFIDLETCFLIMFVGGFLGVITMLIASYVTTHFEE